MEWFAFYAMILLVTYAWTSSAFFAGARVWLATRLPVRWWPLIWCSVCVGTWVTLAFYYLNDRRPVFWHQDVGGAIEAVAIYVIGLHLIQQIWPGFMSSATHEIENEVVLERRKKL